MPRPFQCAIGKSHFNYNTTTKLWFNNGFQEQYVHEGGLAMDFVQPDDFMLLDSYDQWFNETYPGMGDPLATAPADQENGWWGSPYVYEEAAHPTAWTGKTAVDWLQQWSADHESDGDVARRERRLDGDVEFQDDDSIESKDTDSAKFFLKLSFLRPHSPYDPPLRLYDTMKSHLNDGNLPTPEYNLEDGWDVRVSVGDSAGDSPVLPSCLSPYAPLSSPPALLSSLPPPLPPPWPTVRPTPPRSSTAIRAACAT